jgi:hypothetical protein
MMHAGINGGRDVIKQMMGRMTEMQKRMRKAKPH